MKILVIDDDPATVSVLAHAFVDHALCVVDNADIGLAQVVHALWQHDPYDLVFCELALDGLDVLCALRAHREPPICVVMAGYEDIVEATMHAEWVLMKPLARQDVADTVERARLVRMLVKTRHLPRIRRSG